MSNPLYAKRLLEYRADPSGLIAVEQDTLRKFSEYLFVDALYNKIVIFSRQVGLTRLVPLRSYSIKLRKIASTEALKMVIVLILKCGRCQHTFRRSELA